MRKAGAGTEGRILEMGMEVEAAENAALSAFTYHPMAA